MSFLSSLNISGSALTAQKLRMEIIAQNIANAGTTRTANEEPYRRKMVTLKPIEADDSFSSALMRIQGKSPAGVEVEAVVEDERDFKPVYNPSHPHADENGYVMMPNVNTTEEMIDMISATRSYEASVTAINAMKSMAARALDIGR